MCNAGDYDLPSFYSVTTHRARRIHKCYECSRLIQKGERYIRTAGKWDGHTDAYKHCLHCDVMRAWIQRECQSFEHGNIVGEIEEHVRDYGVPAYGFGIARLVVLAGRKWARRDVLLPVPALPPRGRHHDH